MSPQSGLDPAHAGSSGADTPPTSGAGRLKASVRRLGHTVLKTVRADPTGGHNPDAPEPAGDWEHSINERLLAVEQKLASQNRLLLFSFVAIIADVVAKVVTR